MKSREDISSKSLKADFYPLFLTHYAATEGFHDVPAGVDFAVSVVSVISTTS